MFDGVYTLKERQASEPLFFIREALRLQKRWKSLSRQYLRFTAGDSIWLYSRGPLSSDGQQGWKIHISATILSACDVMAAAAPILESRGILFKAAASLEELAKLNSGLWYGYTQVGKFLTVYPTDESQLVETVWELARVLPPDTEAPDVPFDVKFHAAANIFFRYGSFVTIDLINSGGRKVPGIIAPSGALVEDRRDTPCPEWVTPPREIEEKEPVERAASPLNTRFRVFRSISQRGKGGVYEAIDTQADQLRPCVIKEGRRNGETTWDGRDGVDRIRNERNFLRDFFGKVEGLPALFDSFNVDGNFYLITEKIEGDTLLNLIRINDGAISFEWSLDIARQVARIVAQLHEHSVVWRDCKPSNLFLTPEGIVRPIDFEGATCVDLYDPLPWNTPDFTPPELDDPEHLASITTNLPEDLFALGVCLDQIFFGAKSKNKADCQADKNNHSPSIGKIRSLIAGLTANDPSDRPTAAAALELIERHFL